MHTFAAILPLFAVAAPLLTLSCIERNNLWDPYNGCHPFEELPQIRSFYTEKIETIKNSVAVYDSSAEHLLNRYTSAKTANDATLQKNDATHTIVVAIVTANNRIDSLNKTASSCSTAQFKNPLFPRRLDNVSPVTIPTFTNPVLDAAGHEVLSLVAAARNECPKRKVFTDSYVDSLVHFFSGRSAELDALIDTITLFNTQIALANRAIDSINRFIRVHDSLLTVHNDSIAFCRLPLITDPNQLKEKIENLRPGDTVAIGGQSITITDFYVRTKGAGGTWTVIMGNPATMTAITAPRIEIDSSFNIRFINLSFTASVNGIGTRIIGGSDSIEFFNCVFAGNTKYGIDIIGGSSNVSFDNCRILRNGAASQTDNESGGIRIADCWGISLRNVLVARNAGSGIEILSSVVTLNRATIADNTLDGIAYSGPPGHGSFVASNALFAFNARHGIFRNNEQTTRDVFVAADQNNRFFSNSLSEMGGDESIVAANMPFVSADPLFINRDSDDYRIGPQSSLSGRGIGYIAP